MKSGFLKLEKITFAVYGNTTDGTADIMNVFLQFDPALNQMKNLLVDLLDLMRYLNLFVEFYLILFA